MQRNAQIRGFWEHSFTSGGSETEGVQTIQSPSSQAGLSEAGLSEYQYSSWLTFTSDHGPRLKAIITAALEGPNNVGACPVTARVAHIALVDILGKNMFRFMRDVEATFPARSGRLPPAPYSTFTSDAAVIQPVSKGTFTAVRPVCVDALPVVAYVRVCCALIYVWNREKMRRGSTPLWSVCVTSHQRHLTYWIVVFVGGLTNCGAQQSKRLWKQKYHTLYLNICWSFIIHDIQTSPEQQPITFPCSLHCHAFRVCHSPSFMSGQISQGCPQPCPGMALQQHSPLVVLWGLGARQMPFSNLVKQ